jgi:amino-acid N-acetyltransferase
MMATMDQPLLRKARPTDTRAILSLIGVYAIQGLLLPRPYTQVIGKIRDFTVVEDVQGTPLAGVAALHPVGEDLAEIRSLAVREDLKGKGLGRRLVEFCLAEAEGMRFQRVFALTYETGFFGKLGFERVEKSTLPQKIWGDCVHCAKFSDCDEVAMLLTLDIRT